MPYDDPDATDPMALRGVVVESSDDGPVREMAECFIVEYARMGFDSDRILQVFKTSGYAGPFLAYQTLGEQVIRSLIDEQMSIRCMGRPDGLRDLERQRRISLPILDS